MRLLQTVGLFTLPCDKARNTGVHEAQKRTWLPCGFHVGGGGSPQGELLRHPCFPAEQP